MAFSHEVDRNARRMVTHVSGPVEYDDLLAHMNAEVRDRGQSYAELIDARGATARFSSEQVRKFVAVLERLARDSRLGPTAVVVSDDVTYGMVRMLGMFVDETCAIEPFRDPEDAKRWLGWQS